jgi:hypothetical protein
MKKPDGFALINQNFSLSDDVSINYLFPQMLFREKTQYKEPLL